MLQTKQQITLMLEIYIFQEDCCVLYCIQSAYPGDGVAVFLDAIVGLLQTGGFKWRFTHQQGVPEGTDEVQAFHTQSLPIFGLLWFYTYNMHPSDQTSTS